MRRIQGTAWISEYSVNDCTWIVNRTTNVTYKKRRTA